MRPLTVGMTRHADVDALSPGCSPGTTVLLESLERALSIRCTLHLLPASGYRGTIADSIAAAEGLLTGSDAIVAPLPANPTDLEPVFLVRQRLGRRVPMIYLPLGEFPRGAWCYRHVVHHLTWYDVLCLSSTADRDAYRALVACACTPEVVLPFGIDRTPYANSQPDRARVRRDRGLDDGACVLVVHGRITAEKNIHAVVEVFARLAAARPSVQLWLIGPGDGIAGTAPRRPRSGLGNYESRLADAAGGHVNRVLLWGPMGASELAPVLAAADLAVTLTLNRDENFGFAPVEAMAAALPVVGTAWGGVGDVIVDGQTGFLVPTWVTDDGPRFDERTALHRLDRLAGDRALRRRMGLAGQARVDRCFGIDRFAEGILDAIQDRRLAHSPAHPRNHRWTALGERLVAEYSVPVAGTITGRYPLPIPPEPGHAHRTVVAQLLRSYARPVTMSGGAAHVGARDSG